MTNGKHGKVEGGALWYPPAALAMEQQADTVFILRGWWGHQGHRTEKNNAMWNESEIKRWKEKLERARVLLKEEVRGSIFRQRRLFRAFPQRRGRGRSLSAKITEG